MCKTDDVQDDFDVLKRSCKISELDDSLWNDKCDYVDIETCPNLNPNNYNLLALQLNIQSTPT